MENGFVGENAPVRCRKISSTLCLLSFGVVINMSGRVVKKVAVYYIVVFSFVGGGSIMLSY